MFYLYFQRFSFSICFCECLCLSINLFLLVSLLWTLLLPFFVKLVDKPKQYYTTIPQNNHYKLENNYYTVLDDLNGVLFSVSNILTL